MRSPAARAQTSGLIGCRQRAGPAMSRSVTQLTRLLSACRHPGPGRGAVRPCRGHLAARGCEVLVGVRADRASARRNPPGWRPAFRPRASPMRCRFFSSEPAGRRNALARPGRRPPPDDRPRIPAFLLSVHKRVDYLCATAPGLCIRSGNAGDSAAWPQPRQGPLPGRAASRTLCMQRKPELSTCHAAIDN